MSVNTFSKQSEIDPKLIQVRSILQYEWRLSSWTDISYRYAVTHFCNIATESKLYALHAQETKRSAACIISLLMCVLYPLELRRGAIVLVCIDEANLGNVRSGTLKSGAEIYIPRHISVISKVFRLFQ